MEKEVGEIYGVGCDIVNIERIFKSCERYGENFIKRILSLEEIALIPKHIVLKDIIEHLSFCSQEDKVLGLDSFQDRLKSESLDMSINQKSIVFASYLAKRYAAKEAFSKAWGTGIGKEWRFNEIEVANDRRGKPYFFRIKGLDKKYRVHLSLSDDMPFAIAYVVVECIIRS